MLHRYLQLGGDFADELSASSLPRGSKVSWSGVVDGDMTSITLGLSPGRQDMLKKRLNAEGFNVELDYQFESFNWGAGYWRIFVTAITPVEYAEAKHVFDVLTSIVYQVYGNWPQNIQTSVVNVPYKDVKTGNVYQQGAPVYSSAPDTRSENPDNPNRCSDKSGIEWLACTTGFDSTAQQLGLGVGAGVTLVLLAVGLVAIVVLKK